MALELLRARAGEGILTVQYKVSEAEMAAFFADDHEGETSLDDFMAENDPAIAFLDRPARGAVVVDMKSPEHPEVPGPVAWRFTPIAAPAQQAPGAEPAVAPTAWWETAQRDPAQRDERFRQTEVR